MTAAELARLVTEMRAAQRAYFRSRSDSALEASKALEKRVAAACRECLSQPGLFKED